MCINNMWFHSAIISVLYSFLIKYSNVGTTLALKNKPKIIDSGTLKTNIIILL